MIDKEYLENWSDDNGEDVIVDGPYSYSLDQWNRMGIIIIKKLEEKFSVPFDKIGYDPDCWYEKAFVNIDEKNIDHDDGYSVILEEFAKFINEEGIEEF
jgi:hypothetical protein